MIIKNLTSEQQRIELRELTGEKRVYEIALCAHGTTDIDRFLIINNADELAGLVEIEGVAQTTKVVVKEEPQVEAVAPAEEKKAAPVEETTPAFICDICGAEFASARSLASHKNRSHSE